MKKIGVYGGSFDPIHVGHIELAKQARDELNLEKLLFVPVKNQPFKLGQLMSSDEDRVRMLKLALEGEEKLEISYAELESNEISYTLNTLRKIRSQFDQDTEIYFILGTDSFLKIEIWHDAPALLSEFSYAIGARPGYREEELKSCIDHIREVYNTTVVLLNNELLPISSTEIKERLYNGEEIDTLVPLPVERYIYDNGLYH
ncbi:nicotinate-nucleotide adenylyltransferase [Clostridium aminobutyricum]|uniref:Probable nicotinate-nucleotide adenylyltransferase n=1 Tax=Clostridium aminobutyricum TaxID=33953 RepID=A0A939D821_CLOAM|nr:nicotinate-nucleotide adenylyltransferase [Clostridium aminobutyricum]MBN7772443.1 nicotinate (nicotinamide) nucleotide adenylyltransferase [Clostridium aminobutyricum]